MTDVFFYCVFFYIYSKYFVLNAFTLLVWCQEEHITYKNRVIADEVSAWLSVCSGANGLHMVQPVPLSPHYLYVQNL